MNAYKNANRPIENKLMITSKQESGAEAREGKLHKRCKLPGIK